MFSYKSHNGQYMYVEGTAHVHLTIDLRDSTVEGFMLGNQQFVITQINKGTKVHIVYRTGKPDKITTVTND